MPMSCILRSEVTNHPAFCKWKVLPLISSSVRVCAVSIFEFAVAASHYLAPEGTLTGRRAEEHQTRVYGAIARCARAFSSRGARLVRIATYRAHASAKRRQAADCPQ